MRCALSVIALCIAGVTPVFAQDSENDANQVQEVVVTAQFRSQDLQQTPLAITAVTSEMMDARSQSNIMDVATRAPSVTFTTAGGGLGGSQSTAINIRGVGQTDFNLALEPGVALYIDDVYHGTMYASLLELLDLERVEVLRGPQGTLSGKNAEGGAVKLYSKKPNGDRDGYVEGTYGSFDRTDIRAGANFTIAPDKLFLRLSGIAKRRDGYVKRYDYECVTGNQPVPTSALPYFVPPSMVHGGTSGCQLGTEGGQDVTAIRAALRYVATDRVEDTVTIETMTDRSEPVPAVLVYQGTWHGPGFVLPAAPNLAQNFVPPAGSYYNYSTYAGLVGTPDQYALPAISNVDLWGVSNVLDAKLNDTLSLKSISAWRKSEIENVDDGDGSPLARIMNLWNVDFEQFTQELRLNGSVGSRLDWTFGGFYFKADATQGGRISLDGAGDNSPFIPFFVTTDFLFDDPVKVENKSVFGHVELHATEQLIFTAGMRYTKDFKRYGFSRTFAPGYTPSFIDLSIGVTDGAVGVFSGNRNDYRATASYQFTPTVNGYAQFATGFKGGGVNPRPYYVEQVQPFKPETVDSYEAGVKSDLFGRRVRLNVAAFYNKYKDMQLQLFSCPQFVPIGAPPNCALPANVGNSTIKGAELETEIHPLDRMLIDLSASYIDFGYDSVDPATAVLLTDKPPFTPKTKLAAGVQYEIALGTHGSLTPRIDYQYQSEQFSYARNFPNDRIPGYGLANARLTYRDAEGTWEVAASVTNLADKYFFLSRFDQTFPQALPAASYDYASVQPGRPREYALTVRKSF